MATLIFSAVLLVVLLDWLSFHYSARFRRPVVELVDREGNTDAKGRPRTGNVGRMRIRFEGK